jgi:hypothetical protein
MRSALIASPLRYVVIAGTTRERQKLVRPAQVTSLLAIAPQNGPIASSLRSLIRNQGPPGALAAPPPFGSDSTPS